MLTWTHPTESLSADAWFARAPLFEGSWWPAWQQWLAAHSAAKQVAARKPAARSLGEAPGRYVRE
jgi:polyhydroxyalkanoate synthase